MQFLKNLLVMLVITCLMYQMQAQQCRCQTPSCKVLDYYNSEVSVCKVDQSLCKACPICIGSLNDAGICSGPCYQECASSTALRERRFFGGVKDFFDDVGDAIDDVGDTLTDIGSQIVDSVGDFFEDVGDLADDIIEEVSKLPGRIQDALADAAEFAKLAIADLDRLSQDILSHAKAIAGMTISQVKHITERLVSFAVDNLREFLKLLDEQVWQRMMRIFGCMSNWDLERIGILAGRAITSFGPLATWDFDQLVEVGKLFKGVAQGDLDQLQPALYESAILLVSGFTGTSPEMIDRVAGMAKSAFGEVQSWDADTWRGINDIAVGLTTQDFDKIDPAVIGEISQVFGLDSDQVSSIATKALDFAKLFDGSDDDKSFAWQDVARFAQGLTDEQFDEIPFDFLGTFGKIQDLDLSKKQKIVTAVIDHFGDAEKWDSSVWNIIGFASSALNDSQLLQVDELGLQRLNLLQVLSEDQKALIIQRGLELLGSASTWKEEDFSSLSTFLGHLPLAEINEMNLDSIELLLTQHTQLTDLQIQAIFTIVDQLPEKPQSLILKLEDVLDRLPDGAVTSLGLSLFDLLSGTNVTTILSEGKLTAIIQAAEAEFALDPNLWTSEQWQKLGGIASQIIPRLADQLNKETFILIKDVVKDFRAGDMAQLRDRVVELFGSLADIDEATLDSLGHFIRAYNARDMFNANEIAMDFVGAFLDAHKEICDEGGISSISCDENDIMTEATFCEDQLDALITRTMHLFGGANDWTAAIVSALGPLVSKLDPGKLAQLAPDAFEVIFEVSCLGRDIYECVAKEIRYRGESSSRRETQDFRQQLVLMGPAVVGLELQIIESMTAQQLKDNLDIFTSYHDWSLSRLRLLADKARAAFGEPKDWKRDTVTSLQHIIAGLSREHLRAIKASAMSNLNSQVYISLCNTQTLSWLLPSQLESLPEPSFGFTCDSQTLLMTESQMKSSQVSNSAFPEESSGSNGGAIAAAVICSLLLIALIVFAVFYVRSRNKNPKSTHPDAVVLESVDVRKLTNACEKRDADARAGPKPKAKAPPRPRPAPRPPIQLRTTDDSQA